MSEVRLVIRDAQRDIHGTIHGSFADRVIAALSAEPETIEELDTALERFIRAGEWSNFRGFRPGTSDEPYDAGLVIVDLAARLVAYDSTYSSPGPEGEELYHDGNCATEIWIRYRLPDDWKFASDVLDWQALAGQRRRERATHPPLDARAVLYGRPLLEFIASESLAACELVKLPVTACVANASLDAAPSEGFSDAAAMEGDSSERARDERDDNLVREIHVRWLTTSRDDLRGQAPRDVLLAKHKFVDWDLQYRADQWSQLGECPRGLDPESHAFRFAGFGTHEIVEYYELVRHLLWSCHDRLEESSRSKQSSLRPEALTAADFLTTEVPRLERVRDEWLGAPDPESHGLTPREIIDHERARLPEGLTGKDAMIDHDCPLCAMLADLPGPMFWHLDGCNMDDDFAFSFHRTREEWEAEQREREEFHRRLNEEWAERERLGVKSPSEHYVNPDSVWQRSFVASETEQSPALWLFGIGTYLAELTVDLKQPMEERPLIDRLSRDFGNLREVAQSSDTQLSATLIEPVLERFCETLDEVTQVRSDLHEKCVDLQRRLRWILEPPEEKERSEDTSGDHSDYDVPF